MKALLQYKAAALHTVQPRGLSIDEQLISALTALLPRFLCNARLEMLGAVITEEPRSRGKRHKPSCLRNHAKTRSSR